MTATWTRGYPTADLYPAQWHGFQSPAHLKLVCDLGGVKWEVSGDRPLAIAELGCGVGLTSLVLAGAVPASRVIGIDYNPAHVAEARSLAHAAGLDNAEFLDLDLAEIDDAGLDRLPDLDLVTVHGVWTWVADPVRAGIMRLIRRRLKPGGLVMMGYNALPGAASALGLARVVRGVLQAHGGGLPGVAPAAEAVQRLMDAKAVNLGPSGWTKALQAHGASAGRAGYLVHEFSTEHWRPSFHADMAEAMATAQCDYVGSATLDENFPAMSLGDAQVALWEAAPDEAARQLIFDLCVPRAFRRDVYVRGARPIDRHAALDATTLVQVATEDEPMVLRAQAGEARLPPAADAAVRSALARGPQSIAALRTAPGCEHINPAELAALACGSGRAQPQWMPPAQVEPELTDRSRRLTRVLADRMAPYGEDAGTLVIPAPALGGGMRASALELAVVRRLLDDPDLSADALVARLAPPDGDISVERRIEVAKTLSAMLEARLPVWRALGVVPT